MVDLHVFGGASVLGYCAAAYVVVHQPSSVKQGLIASKSRLSKRDMTISRLELIAAHVATNLAANIKEALPSQNIRSVTCWTDSTVVLHWLKDKWDFQNANLLPESMFLLKKTPQILVAEEALLESYQNFGGQGQLGLRNFPNGLSSLT